MQRVAAIRRRAGAGYRTLRRLTETALHAPRHKAVARRVRGMPRPRTIVVVCYGNICRSPYLEALLRRALPDIRVSSAGFVGPGRSVPEHSRVVAARRGIDLGSHRSQMVSRELLRSADLVIVMDANQARALRRGFGVDAGRIIIAGDLDPLRSGTRAILDPWNRPIEDFESSFARLDRCADRLTSLLNGAP